jgi:hypothetical protein
LDREEFGVDGEFGFLKIPFLKLIGRLSLGTTEARKAIEAMSSPGLLEEMSLFLKMLTVKAYDLILLERQPIPTETVGQLIEGFEKHAKEFSLRQWWRVVTALPAKALLSFAAAIVSLSLSPLLFELSKEVMERSFPPTPGTRPETMTVSRSREADSNLPKEALFLAKGLAHPTGTERQSLIIVVQADAFATPTPAFVVEVSHPERPIRDAFAFVSTEARSKEFTVVPVQRDGGRFRALLSPQAKGKILSFVVEVEGDKTDDAITIGKSIMFRPLD